MRERGKSPRDGLLREGETLEETLLASANVSYAIIGYFLRRYWIWARNFAFVFSAIGVVFFPIGTVLGSVIVLCIDRANRAGLFPPPAHVRAQAEKKAAEAEESAPILRLEPDLSAESAS